MSPTARLIAAGTRALIKRHPDRVDATVRHIRKALNRPPFPVMMASGVHRRVESVGGVACDVLEGDHSDAVLLYAHGGGFVAGVTRTYFNLCSRLAARLQAQAVLPHYRLAPEHPYPAGPEDIIAVYEDLLARGWPPQRIVVAGDSAGGSLVLGLLLACKARGLPQPAACLAISPATDQSLRGGTHASNDRSDPMLSQRIIEHLQEAYVPNPERRREPLASPVFGDWAGCAPLMLTVSRHECLHEQSTRLRQRAEAASVPVRWLERPKLFHVWPIFLPLLPEARQDFEAMAGFLAEQLAAEAPRTTAGRATAER